MRSLLGLSLVVSLIPAWAAGQTASAQTPLTAGYKAEHRISANQLHTYVISLKRGQGLNAAAVQDGVDLVLDVFDPKGKKIATIDSPNGTKGAEPIELIAVEAGEYRIVVRPLESEGEGRYELRVDSIDDADKVAEKTAARTYGAGAVQRLWRAYYEGGQQGLDKAVEELKGKTPIIEAGQGGVDAWVTFLYPGDASTKSVQLMGGPDNARGGRPLERFEDSTLWVARVPMPRDARFAYSFTVNGSKRVEGDNGKSFNLPTSEQARDSLNPSLFMGRSLFEMPGAPRQPYIVPGSGPKGRLETKTLKSALLGEDRTLGIYTPPGYSASGPACNILLVFDGEAYGTTPQALIPTPTIVENLVNEGKIGPTIAVLINNLGLRNRDLVLNKKFADFVATELVPFVRANYNASAKAEDVVVAGSSFGGLCSAYTAFMHPTIIGNVLSQSGAFWPTPDWQTRFRMPYLQTTGWLVEQYMNSPKLPIRFFMEVGLFDGGTTYQGPTRQLRDILRLKGNEVIYSEFAGGHDYVCWRGSLADGLIALLGKAR